MEPGDFSKEKLISVVLPVFNEAATIEADIDAVRSALSGVSHSFEIIVVDDGSTDRTAAIAEAKGVRLIRHGINRGVGAARKTGTLEASGDLVVTADADGTYPMEAIPELLKFFPDYDMVVGARIGAKVEEPFHRRLIKYLICRLAGYLSGVHIPDLNSGLRAYKKSVARSYFSLLPNGHSWEGTITLSFLCNGHPVRFVPIDYFKRKGGRSSFRPFSDTYSFIFLLIRTVMYFNPLRVFLPLALSLLAIASIKIIYDWLVYRHIGGLDVSLFLSGILIGMGGFLADLLVILHKKHPPRI